MKLPLESLHDILQAALDSEIGYTIETNEPKLLRVDLLEARKQLAPAYDELMTFIPEGRNEVFIAHRSVELPD